MLRGLGNYFRTGSADRNFNQMDSYVVKSLHSWQRRRVGQRGHEASTFDWPAALRHWAAID
jgi:Group II intron, maturase-specific domain